MMSCVRAGAPGGRLGVRRADARDMAAELEADLAAAAAEGVPARELVGHDPRGFALSWAREKGVAGPRLWLGSDDGRGARRGLPRSRGRALRGLRRRDLEHAADRDGIHDESIQRMPGMRPRWLILALYVIAAIFTYAGALAAVSAVPALATRSGGWHHGASARLGACRRSSRCTVGLTIGFSASQGFSTDRAAVIGDLLIPTAALALSVAGVRICAVRRAAGRPAHQPVVIGQTVP